MTFGPLARTPEWSVALRAGSENPEQIVSVGPNQLRKRSLGGSDSQHPFQNKRREKNVDPHLIEKHFPAVKLH
jgi:hypothetical protein